MSPRKKKVVKPESTVEIDTKYLDIKRLPVWAYIFTLIVFLLFVGIVVLAMVDWEYSDGKRVIKSRSKVPTSKIQEINQ